MILFVILIGPRITDSSLTYICLFLYFKNIFEKF